MDDANIPNQEPPRLAAHATQPAQESGDNSRTVLIVIIVAVLLILILCIGGVILLAQPSTDTPRVRDIFIIFMALESLLLGVALVILIVQLARLINLLQNEIKPILESTNETVSTLRGTSEFLSNNLSEPVIKLNEYAAALGQLLKVIGLARGPAKPKNTRKP